MSQVEEEKITNEKVRKIFFNIPDLRSLIAIRQCRFIGRVIRGPNNNPPKLLLTAWCNNKRVNGGQLTTNKKSIVKSLQLLLPNKMGNDKQGLLANWIDIARDKNLWNYKIKKTQATWCGHPRTWTFSPQQKQP